MRRLLILSCSGRKRTTPGLLPAVERYDGTPYRTLRRFLRARPDAELDVFILSAEFGLIHRDEPLLYYDRLMTPLRARELAPTVAARLRDVLTVRHYDEVFIRAGA